MRNKLISQLNRFIIGTWRKRNYVEVIRLDSKRYALLEEYLRKHNLNFYGEDIMYQHRDGKWGRKFMNVDIKCHDTL